ncbi:F/Y-rich N-terminus family protein [Trichomonas vaginalis G3]|uniref:F/Y-rich N-terminus family protein n=1 Tax=Trichomonas vaginalis (strain ATCC PRA-98 / G3) TaxID=412133 RepID=A2EX18_TRIV3|nr:histone methyltransferase activity (H3-K4 specific) [Trichomonas vaginalis G3]EAY02795.1 F/Y-rich N-terminus family protein [Trichomonas vaginalis G3]KAI5537562.1 histone methyltransferase activity (H3-K4 specific) [Trichomonas vaginalis G3]|eukprot:XP_001315018.1 F/Y-rich N-terminus family protein [Trichomonas vaginalis G3]
MRRSHSRTRHEDDSFSDSNSDTAFQLNLAEEEEHKNQQDSDEASQEEISQTTTSSDDEASSENSSKSPFEYILGYKLEDETNNEKMLFVKYKGKAYIHCEWIPLSKFLSFPEANRQWKRYEKKNPYPPPEPYYDQSYNEPERIIATKKENEQTLYLTKWKNLDYNYCTWEDNMDQSLIDSFYKYDSVTEETQFKKPSKSQFKPIEGNPTYKNGLQLFNYQLEGVNWLLKNWYSDINCILADEMGLGKTIQAVAFFERIHRVEKLPGPYMVIAPLATLPHWQRQIESWTDLYVIRYTGNRQAREMLREYEFYKSNSEQVKFDIFLTSYEVLYKDVDELRHFKFPAFVVDEAHRLKNKNSKILSAIQHLKTSFRVLLTGTPLQNSIEELQSLLEFLHPGEFSDLNNDMDAQDIQKLRVRLQPHLLRRLKVDTDQSIAPKEETIIECTMTKYQKQFYRAILEQNSSFLSGGTNLLNIAMDLRKVCIHPFLIKGAEDKILADMGYTNQPDKALEAIIRSSGKMILIDKLLPKLKADGHRVLIFSQMTNLLDILQDYLAATGYKFLRLDGQVKPSVRQSLIDHFNAPDSDDFIFLLSTRAGGLGINLNAADTVIIFDSDWNPQNDLQAQARCHRIGQQKTVKVYRLITKGTYEQNMFEISSKKLGLGHAILDKTKKKELDTLLRKGAYYALNDVEEDTFGEDDIDQILSRSKTMVINEAAGSMFSKAQFDVDENTNIDINDPEFWQKILPNAQAAEEEEIGEYAGLTNVRIRKKADVNFKESDEEEEGEPPRGSWSHRDRERLQQLLFRYGWGRWDVAPTLGLTRTINEVKLAARAFLRTIMVAAQDKTDMETAQILLDEGNSKEFDDKFTTEEEAKERDKEIANLLRINEEEFVLQIQHNAVAWIRRLDVLYYISQVVNKANGKIEELNIPQCHTQPPSQWWSENDDKCLVMGTYKCGFACYDKMLNDTEIPWSLVKDKTLDPPSTANLTPRLKRIAIDIRKMLNGELYENNPNYKARKPRGPMTWKKRDKSAVVQQLQHQGIPLKEDGEFDWEKFRDITGFTEKTDEEMEQYVKNILDGKDNDEKEKEQKQNTEEKSQENKEEQKEEVKSDRKSKPHSEPKSDKPETEKTEEEKENEGKTEEKEEKADEKGKKKSKKASEGDEDNQANRLKQRVESLTRLRRLFIKYGDDKLKEYFETMPRWRNVPNLWTNEIEFKFFKNIAEKGWGLCAEILKQEEFVPIVGEKPPQFVTNDIRVMKRLMVCLDLIENTPLEQLKEQDAARVKRRPAPSNDTLPMPSLKLNEDGLPDLPLLLTASSSILSFGTIVWDRPGFHTEKYIYPAGYKITKLYRSTINPTERVKYICEIIDNGGPGPLFRVTNEKNPEVFFEGASPTSPWSIILKIVQKLRENEAAKQLSISGPDYYGLAAPETIYVIQHMKNADKCEGYVFREFSEADPAQKPPRRQSRKQSNPANTANPAPVNPIPKQDNKQMNFFVKYIAPQANPNVNPEASRMALQYMAQQNPNVNNLSLLQRGIPPGPQILQIPPQLQATINIPPPPQIPQLGGPPPTSLQPMAQPLGPPSILSSILPPPPPISNVKVESLVSPMSTPTMMTPEKPKASPKVIIKSHPKVIGAPKIVDKQEEEKPKKVGSLSIEDMLK